MLISVYSNNVNVFEESLIVNIELVTMTSAQFVVVYSLNLILTYITSVSAEIAI